MCAVVGAIIQSPTSEDLNMLHRVFLESKIRGMHATGVSYVKDGKVNTIKEPKPADEFDFRFKDYINEDGNLYLIGHCRYSTSDLEYNQPISNESLSVAHNGVITQELPENWEKLYGYVCETKNDSELLLHTIQENVSPLRRWADSSLSVCVLSEQKTVKVFRNGKRPIYMTPLRRGVIITSTEDIPKRASINYPTTPIPMNTYITFDEHVAMTVEVEKIDNAKDLQP